MSAICSLAVRADESFLSVLLHTPLRLVEGGWSEYRVVEETMGVVDTSILHLTVTGKGACPSQECFWLQVEQRPLQEGPRLEARLLVVKTAPHADSPPSSYVRRLMVREGSGDFEEKDPAELDGIEREAEYRWEKLGESIIEVGSEQLKCQLRSGRVDYRREKVVGGSKLIRETKLRCKLYTCEQLPVLPVARCEWTRMAETRLDPPIRGVPVAEPKTYRARIELLRFGMAGGGSPAWGN